MSFLLSIAKVEKVMVQLSAIAVVGRSSKPLYTEVFEKESADTVLALEFLMYASLDVCEEIVASVAAQQSNTTSAKQSGGVLGAKPFLSDLLQDRGYETWGYQTSCGTRIIVATKGAQTKGADRDDVERKLKAINEEVSRALCSPFRDPEENLGSSARFLSQLSRLRQ